jgi:hypothetical protein
MLSKVYSGANLSLGAVKDDFQSIPSQQHIQHKLASSHKKNRSLFAGASNQTPSHQGKFIQQN